MKKKTVNLTTAFLLLSLALLNISVFNSPFHVDKQTPTGVEFLVHTGQDPNEFLSVWDTTKTSEGSSGSNQVHFPLEWDGLYNFTVDWGDGSNDTITIWNQAAVTHTYVLTGVYNITIAGTIVGWCFNNGGDRLKILEIQQWGRLRLGNSGKHFFGCSNLELKATDNLNLTGTTYLIYTFALCANLGNNGNMNGWDVSRITDMRYMFSEATSFNQPIGNWNVSNVTFMNGMFAGATMFNQPIGNWDVSSVLYMHDMFSSASSFNQPIENWNVSSVISMKGMFSWSSSFNQPIGNWDVSRVTTMEDMFRWASSFNQLLGNWNISSVADMEEMFYGVTLSTSNYDNLLMGWSQLSLQTGISFHAGNSKYSKAAKDARQTIITNFSWTIIDGGLEITESHVIPGYEVTLLIGITTLLSVVFFKVKFKKEEIP